METVEAKLIPEIQSFMKDFWPFIKQTIGCDGSDQDWGEVIKKTSEIGERYEKTSFKALFRAWILVYLDWLEDRTKGKDDPVDTYSRIYSERVKDRSKDLAL